MTLDRKGEAFGRFFGRSREAGVPRSTSLGPEPVFAAGGSPSAASGGRGRAGPSRHVTPPALEFAGGAAGPLPGGAPVGWRRRAADELRRRGLPQVPRMAPL